jgi:hypothetical protein
VSWLFCFYLMAAGFQVSTSQLLAKCSTSWAMSQSFLDFSYFSDNHFYLWLAWDSNISTCLLLAAITDVGQHIVCSLR